MGVCEAGKPQLPTLPTRLPPLLNPFKTHRQPEGRLAKIPKGRSYGIALPEMHLSNITPTRIPSHRLNRTWGEVVGVEFH